METRAREFARHLGIIADRDGEIRKLRNALEDIASGEQSNCTGLGCKWSSALVLSHSKDCVMAIAEKALA